MALDELPQLINILRGEMSLVGPRALSIQEHAQFTAEEPRFPERLRVLPGATGVALLYLPRHCSPRRRLRYDMIYIRRASLRLDIRLIVWTILESVRARWETGNHRPELLSEED